MMQGNNESETIFEALTDRPQNSFQQQGPYPKHLLRKLKRSRGFHQP
jgi:hypothetical protein